MSDTPNKQVKRAILTIEVGVEFLDELDVRAIEEAIVQGQRFFAEHDTVTYQPVALLHDAEIVDIKEY